MKLSSLHEARHVSQNRYFVWVSPEEGHTATVFFAAEIQGIPNGVYEEEDPEFDSFGPTYGVPCQTINQGIQKLQKLLPNWPSPWKPGAGTDKSGLWNNKYHDPPSREEIINGWNKIQ